LASRQALAKWRGRPVANVCSARIDLLIDLLHGS
jgi:hypothetical protein